MLQRDMDPYQEGGDMAHQHHQYGSGLPGGGCHSLHSLPIPVFAQGTLLNSSTDARLMQACLG